MSATTRVDCATAFLGMVGWVWLAYLSIMAPAEKVHVLMGPEVEITEFNERCECGRR